MHDAFETAMQKIDSYSGKGSFDGWLYRITVNKALQYVKHNKKTINKDQDFLDYYSNKDRELELPKNAKYTIHSANFEVSDLLKAIDKLPQHHKLVFNLYVLEKLSHKEISNELNISVNTSKSHLNRARKKLKEILFEKAKEKDKHDRKKYLFILFPFYFSLDRLYANKFNNYKIRPTLSLTKLNNKQIYIKTNFVKKNIVILMSIVSLSVITTVYYTSKKPIKVYNKKTMESSIQNNNLNLESYINELDNLFSKQKNIEINQQTLKSNKKPVVINVPVVVRKKVIIKDTIVK